MFQALKKAFSLLKFPHPGCSSFLLFQEGGPLSLVSYSKNFFRGGSQFGGSQFALGTKFLVFPGKKRLRLEKRSTSFQWEI